MLTPFVLAALLSGLIAQATPAPPPVQVTACTVVSGESVSNPMLGGAPPASVDTPGVLTIAFVNESPKAVARIAFTINYGDFMQQIVDEGAYAQGIAISHTFVAPAQASAATCSVASVTFADGSVWQRQ